MSLLDTFWICVFTLKLFGLIDIAWWIILIPVIWIAMTYALEKLTDTNKRK